MSLPDGTVMAMAFAMDSVRIPPRPITTSACAPRARVTPSSTVRLVALGTTSSNTMYWVPFLSRISWTLLIDLPLVEDGLGDEEGALTVLRDQLADPVDRVQPEHDAGRYVEQDIRHGRAPLEKKAENPEGYLR